MFQIITATFEDGVLKPAEPLDLPPRCRVRLTVESLEDSASEELCRRAWEDLERLWSQSALDSHGERLRREQLHERR